MDGAEPRLDGLKPAAVSVGPAELDRARFGFDQGHPHRSARRRLYLTQAIVAAALISTFICAALEAPATTFDVVHFSALALFAIAILWRLFAAASLTPLLSRLAEPAHWPTYTILCPLYREANVVADLAAALGTLDYPKHALDIKLLVEGDDADTIAAALAVSGPSHFEVVIVPAAAPRTKPKALNVGLARARGEYVVVYDAEDRPHPLQLRAALAAFEDGDERLAGVQAHLSIDNAGASWLTRQFAAEYAIQFRELLPFLTRLGLPLPLGGSSNHFRTDVLQASGGWDPFNVTEDADLGYRLARDGYRFGMISPPTWEEAPVTFATWLNQRARWIKGHLQTWLVLMRDPIGAARGMGLGAFASMQLMLGGGLLAALVHGPLAFIVLVAALSHYNLTPVDFALALSGYCVAAFAALTASALANDLGHARAAFTMPLYWPLSTIAALKAIADLVMRPHHWDKTHHGVSQRDRHAVPPAAERASAASTRRRA